MNKHLLTALLALGVIAGAIMVSFGNPFAVQQSPSAAAPRGAKPSRAMPLISVTLAKVGVAPYQTSFTALGTARAQNSVTLVARVSGEITEVLFSGTQMVSQGDVLFRLDAEVERINVDIAQAALNQAEDKVARLTALQASKSGTVTNVVISEAQAELAIAQGQLALARQKFSERSIIAPIAGRLGLSDLEPGGHIAAGDDIMRINDTTAILTEFELPERAASVLAPDMAIRVTTDIWPGQVFAGKVTAFDSQIDPETRTISVRAALDNPQGALWPGMSMVITLDQPGPALAVIPALALGYTRDGAQVWLAENDVVRPVPVIIRHRLGDRVWVEADLPAGSIVVEDGVHKLRPGAKIVDKGPGT